MIIKETMDPIISKEEFNRLINLKGKVRGMAVKGYGDYILKEKGEKGLRKLEETITNLGYPIKYREIKTMDFYPLGLEGISLLVLQRLFNFDDEKIQEMGKFQAKFSIVIRLLMRYLVSIEKAAQGASKMWRSYHTSGDLTITELNKEKRYAILRIENFRVIPSHCHHLIGYFSTIVQLIVKNKVTCKEIKCPFRGDEYHEFLLKW
jgi:hypothetical protein